MATKSKAPTTGRIHVEPFVLKDAVARLGHAGASAVTVQTRFRHVVLTGGGFDVQVELTLDCQYKGRLAAVVDFKALRAAVTAIRKDADEVVITQNSKSLRLQAGRGGSSVTLLDQEPQEVPDHQSVADDDIHVWAVGAELADAIGAVAHAASRDDTRPLLCAVLLEGGGSPEGGEALTGKFKGPHVAATDSFRLAVRPLPGARGDFRIHANAVGLAAAVKGLAADEGAQVLSGPGEWVQVRRAGERWLIHRSGGEWPKWRQLVPEDRLIHFTCEREELLKATAIATKQQGSEVSLKWRVPATVKTLKAGEGQARHFGIEPRYLKQAVESIATEKVRVEFMAPLRPVKVIGGDTFVLIMPIRIGADRVDPPRKKSEVPLRVEIGVDEAVLSMAALEPLPDPAKVAEADTAAKAAKDLADVTGVAKRKGNGG